MTFLCDRFLQGLLEFKRSREEKGDSAKPVEKESAK